MSKFLYYRSTNGGCGCQVPLKSQEQEDSKRKKTGTGSKSDKDAGVYSKSAGTHNTLSDDL